MLYIKIGSIPIDNVFRIYISRKENPNKKYNGNFARLVNFIKKVIIYSISNLDNIKMSNKLTLI